MRGSNFSAKFYSNNKKYFLFYDKYKKALRLEPVYLCVGAFNLKGFLAIKGGSNLMKNFNFDSPSGMKEKKTVSSKPSENPFFLSL